MISNLTNIYRFRELSNCIFRFLTLIIFVYASSSANAANRPPISGWFASNSSTGVTAIFQDIQEAGKAICVGGFIMEFGYIQNNTLFCKVRQYPGDTIGIVQYISIINHVETCPGYNRTYPYGGGIVCSDNTEKPPVCECHGNPIKLGAKEKIQVEPDYIGLYHMEFIRNYSNKKMFSGNELMSTAWGHSYSKKLTSSGIVSPDLAPAAYFFDKGVANGGAWLDSPGAAPTSQSARSAQISRPDGYGYYFNSTDGGVTWTADSDLTAKLTVDSRDANGVITQWRFTTPTQDVEIYDQQGKLLSIQFLDGVVQAMKYSDVTTDLSIAPKPGLLIQVTDNLNRSINLQYNGASQLVKMLDPTGREYGYAYDGNGILSSVTHPNGLKRMYLYNEPAYAPQLAGARMLTGTSDEVSAGVFSRLGTFYYDSNGYPISTEHPNGIEKYSFDYASNSMTDPLGAKRTYGFSTVNGRVVQTSVTQPNGSGSTVSKTVAYDNNNNVRYVYDYLQNLTLYTNDLTRNLETSRVEASGTPNARTITTEWHATLRRPARIAEPKRLTTYSYDAQGNVLTKTIQATTDTTGTQGLNASVTGTTRSWVYTYNQFSQVLTEKGPRTDVNDMTTYTYDIQGNLASIANAAGHTTTLSNYDADGHVGAITDPNGLITAFTYTASGWLASRTKGGETTSYAYDGLGQLTTVTLPDNSTINYSYDAGRRLTQISDSLGNSITYTLDAMGNRTSEVVTDATGALARQTTRVYDVLNFIKQQTGGVQ